MICGHDFYFTRTVCMKHRISLNEEVYPPETFFIGSLLDLAISQSISNFYWCTMIFSDEAMLFGYLIVAWQ